MELKSAAEVESRLLAVLEELSAQRRVAASYPADTLPFDDDMKQLREWIDVTEWGLAYEVMIADLEAYPFVLSGKACVALVELALHFGFKYDE